MAHERALGVDEDCREHRAERHEQHHHRLEVVRRDGDALAHQRGDLLARAARAAVLGARVVAVALDRLDGRRDGIVLADLDARAAASAGGGARRAAVTRRC